MNDVQNIMNSVARQVNVDHQLGSAFSPSHRAARPMKEGDQMATRTRWDPFQDLRDAQEEMAQMTQMSQMLARALGLQGQPQGSATATAWAPALDISERKDAYLVTVELPGVEAEDLEITLEDGLLTIQGERIFAHDSSEQQFHRVERRYGAFRRSITLPAQVQAEQIEASFDNGVLQIVVPKMEEATPKRIQIRPGRAEIPAASSEDTTPS
jgi:HSP20 family protein